MIDPILSLAFSIHANKGIYALLLGSGVSRPSGIPTGWEIMLDLIRKLAHLMDKDCEPDPAGWYKGEFGEDPDYAKLLDAIAKSAAERSQLLRSYLEPTEEERDRGLKLATKAHKAVARLVASGHIRVIVTTNFDRLLERALEDAGVVPTIISTPDSIEGALPLPHTSCCVIKVHGDYLDSRIKNTPAELSKYDERVDRLLDRILDEFGLVVCGWSGEWDIALRTALERCQSHRFTTFWAVKGEPSEAAQKLIELRRAEIVRIPDADSFFQQLAEKVTALQDLDRPHPLSAKVAVASLKRYLVEDRYRIELHDLMMGEVERLRANLSEEHFPLQGVAPNGNELEVRLKRYEAASEILISLMVTWCFWGKEDQEELWAKCLERIANPPRHRPGYTAWIQLRLYPALLLLYAAGIAAIEAQRYSTLAVLLKEANIRDDDENRPLVLGLHAWAVMDKQFAQQLPGMERRYTPVSDHLCDVLREPLREILPEDDAYEDTFDRFEYLLALVYTDLREKQNLPLGAPIGRFGWRNRDFAKRHIATLVESEVAEAGDMWPPLQAGLFDGSVERFKLVKSLVIEVWKRFPMY
jgi:hypothetical protein